MSKTVEIKELVSGQENHYVIETHDGYRLYNLGESLLHNTSFYDDIRESVLSQKDPVQFLMNLGDSGLIDRVFDNSDVMVPVYNLMDDVRPVFYFPARLTRLGDFDVFFDFNDEFATFEIQTVGDLSHSDPLFYYKSKNSMLTGVDDRWLFDAINQDIQREIDSRELMIDPLFYDIDVFAEMCLSDFKTINTRVKSIVPTHRILEVI